MIVLTASKQHVPRSHYKGPGALGIRVTYPWQEITALSPLTPVMQVFVNKDKETGEIAPQTKYTC